ncbi:SDR family oxidoreductase [Microbacterium sp.]|uniref:SDR family oxidoreductase n=1 Tax=Microbacterium sp. TaxID=51671 RepID=UPI003A8EBC63
MGADWLVTGGTGLLGANALVQLSESGSAVGVARSAPLRRSGRADFVIADLSSSQDRDGLVDRVAPRNILHAAAIATIEGCESDPVATRELNVRSAEDLAGQAKTVGSRFIFISTDAVFDGERGEYAEGDPTNPTTEYGRSKVEAEQRVLAANPDAVVARVNFYGWSPSGTRSLAEYFINALSRGGGAGGFTDVTVSTTYVKHLIAALQQLATTDESGIFHVVAGIGASKYEFGREVARAFGFDPELIEPVLSTSVLSTPRGSDLRLRTDKLDAVLGARLPSSVAGINDLRLDKANGHAQAVARYRS